MKSFSYLYGKVFKKILRGKCITGSDVDATSKIHSGCSIVNCRIGRYSYVGYDCELINCTIGAFCSLASNIHIGGAEHPLDWVSTSPVFQNVRHSGPDYKFANLQLPPSARTIIDNDVWIGVGAIVKAGVHIGNGAVVAAGAVVTKDVEPYSIVGGCPARHIRYRFEQDMIQKLQKTEWWNMDTDRLSALGAFVKAPKEFVNKIEQGGGKNVVVSIFVHERRAVA